MSPPLLALGQGGGRRHELATTLSLRIITVPQSRPDTRVWSKPTLRFGVRLGHYSGSGMVIDLWDGRARPNEAAPRRCIARSVAGLRRWGIACIGRMWGRRGRQWGYGGGTDSLISCQSAWLATGVASGKTEFQELCFRVLLLIPSLALALALSLALALPLALTVMASLTQTLTLMASPSNAGHNCVTICGQ